MVCTRYVRLEVATNAFANDDLSLVVDVAKRVLQRRVLTLRYRNGYSDVDGYSDRNEWAEITTVD